jgi:hypothetical protein
MLATSDRAKRTLLSLLSIFLFASGAFAQAPSRTPWQMYRNPIVTLPPGSFSPSLVHGDVRLYDFAPPIPPANANLNLGGGNGGWNAAPNGSTIGFGNGSASRLSGCFIQADFTFFQTLVDIPTGTTLSTFTINFSGMDDGSRITIFNSANPSGLVVPGSYVFLSGGGTTNLAPYVVAGEINRVVITQVDDCASGNQLLVANVVLNGTVVVTPPPFTPPAFTIPYDAPAGACICTPLLMNTDIAGSQRWWVKAQGGPLTITAIAHAVNGADPERVEARVFDPANALVATLVAQYPGGTPGGTEVSGSTVQNAAPGALYRVEVTTPPPTVGTQPHFRLKFENAEAAATGSPSAASFEHEPMTWLFNVGASESLNLRLLAADPPDPSVSVNYQLFDPTGALHSTGTLSATSSSEGQINVAGALAGTWALAVDPSAHHRLSKTSGADRGIYISWNSSGEGTLEARASDGNTGNPAFTAGPLEFIAYNSANVEVARQLTTTGVADFGHIKLPAGTYTVQIIAPAGFTAASQTITVTIMCDQAALANFTVADITPPVIDSLESLLFEAVGPSGAPATWVATGSDFGRGPVPVVCVPPPGTFPLGTTTVVCTAVDLAGNPAEPVSFSVTVQDTTAPSGACTASYNPSTKNVPRASRQNEDGFYVVSGSDTVSAVTIKIGGYTLQQGETVKFTQSPGTNGVVLVNSQGREPIRHFRVGPGDPVLTITDAAGNSTTQTCYVPPIPK